MLVGVSFFFFALCLSSFYVLYPMLSVSLRFYSFTKRPRHVTLDIHVLAWNKYKNVAVLNRVKHATISHVYECLKNLFYTISKHWPI
jgi:hypothetical protein